METSNNESLEMTSNLNEFILDSFVQVLIIGGGAAGLGLARHFPKYKTAIIEPKANHHHKHQWTLAASGISVMDDWSKCIRTTLFIKHLLIKPLANPSWTKAYIPNTHHCTCLGSRRCHWTISWRELCATQMRSKGIVEWISQVRSQCYPRLFNWPNMTNV